MRKSLTKISMLLFILCLSAALCGAQVQAKVYKGKWKDIHWKKTINWEYDSRTKRLTISGKGKMESCHANDEAHPPVPGWQEFEDSIKEIVIEEGVTNAGEEMLGISGGKNLRSVKLADSVREIGSCAFGNSYGAKKLKKISLPPHLEKIGGLAFESSGLTEVTIPSGVKKIGWGAFNDCENLRKVTIEPGLKKTGEENFQSCTKLEKVILSKGLEAIGNRCFFNCWKLKEVILPEGLEVIGKESFAGCWSLKTVTLPKSLRKLKEKCFSSVRLQNVTIPENVEEIGKEAFRLTEKALGKGKTRRKVVIKSKKIYSFGKNVFGEGDQYLTIEVPESKLEEYQNKLYAKGLPKHAKVVAYKSND